MLPFRYCAIVGLAVAISAAPSISETHSVEQPVHGPEVHDDVAQRRLSHAELSRLFGRDLRLREQSGGRLFGVRAEEYFYRDGRYRGCGDRTVVSGRHHLRGDRLCVQTRQTNTCRYVFAVASGYRQAILKPDSTFELAAGGG